MNTYEYFVKLACKFLFIWLGIMIIKYIQIRGLEYALGYIAIYTGLILWESTVKFNITNQVIK